MTIMTSAKIDMPILYFDMVIKNGKTVMRLANLLQHQVKQKLQARRNILKSTKKSIRKKYLLLCHS